MNEAILVDTNVMIYAVDVDSQFHQFALNFLLYSDARLYTTSKNLTEFLVALTRSQNMDIDGAKALDVLDGLLPYMQIIYPSSESWGIFAELVRKYRPQGLWIHDIEIASIALANGITKIATKNVGDFSRIHEIEIVSEG